MNDYWQACSQQCKPCFLGNACNGGWQDGAEHFNKRSKFEGGVNWNLALTNTGKYAMGLGAKFTFALI